MNTDRKQGEWFTEFFGGLYGQVLGGGRHEFRAVDEARMVRKLMQLHKGQRLLDIPCGLGRMARMFARLGLDVTGVDLTAGYIRRARHLGGRQGLNVRFIRGDMRDIDFDGEFDAAVNWFSSFGYFTDAGNLEFCRRVLRALRPGGQFLVDVTNKTWMVRHLHSGHDETIEGVRIVNRPRWHARTSRMHDVWTMSKAERIERRALCLRVYSGPELRALLRSAGLVDIRLFGYPPLGRLTRHSRRLIALARRPAGKDNRE